MIHYQMNDAIKKRMEIIGLWTGAMAHVSINFAQDCVVRVSPIPVVGRTDANQSCLHSVSILHCGRGSGGDVPKESYGGGLVMAFNCLPLGLLGELDCPGRMPRNHSFMVRPLIYLS